MVQFAQAPHTPSVLRRTGCWITLLSILPVSIGGLYLVENWIGARELTRVEFEVAAADIELDPWKIPSARPPDEQNFCALPLLLAIGSGSATGPEIEQINRIAEWYSIATKAGAPLQSSRSLAATNWRALRDAVAAADPAARIELGNADPVQTLSSSLERDLAPVFAELSSAVSRPQSYLIPSYLDELREHRKEISGGLWIKDIRRLALVCYLRAAMALESGEVDRAVESIRFLLRLSEGSEAYGTAVAGLVGISIRSLALNTAWSATGRRMLPAQAWRELIADFHIEQPLERLPHRIQNEMIYSNHAFEDFRRSPEQLWIDEETSGHQSAPGAGQRFIASFVPRGWFDANLATVQAIYLELSQRTQNSDLDDRFKSKEWLKSWIGTRGFPWHNHVARSLMSVDWVSPVASNHATCRIAETACALEAYWMDHHGYPNSLDALVPTILNAVPVDLDGRSIRYAQDKTTGRYRLWSIGSDGIDNGGVEMAKGGRTPKSWSESIGDWVWQYPH